jgi:hypothetical protein
MAKRKSGSARRVSGHDVHVRFGDDGYSALAAYATKAGLALNGSVRLLVERGLAVEGGRPVGDPDAALMQQLKTLTDSALASLIAIEQNQRLLISMLPDGAERAEQAWDEAATGARRRLIRIDRALAEEEL